MRIAVLGAGVIGVTSAWYLARDGHDVVVIDRQPGPALETSFANGGQISVSHAEPWANPGALGRIVKWLGREDSPLLWRLRADYSQWSWGLKFLRQCTAARTRENIKALVTLGLRSREQLQCLRDELGLHYDQQLKGILHIYTDPAEFERACQQSEFMSRLGCERHPVSASEVMQIEPALACSSVTICGGTYTASDESGDAHIFSQRLAAVAQTRGVRFRYGETIAALGRAGDCIRDVQLVGGESIEADAYVMACGSYSAGLLKTAGVRAVVYPAKGYSATFHDDELASEWPDVSLTDDARKLVFSRLGNRLRVAGTAEFDGFNSALNQRRCQAIVQRAQQFFPTLAGARQIDFWAGLRPSTPGNVPLVCKGPLTNLWLNTGHGTLGWTLACGSAELLTELLRNGPCSVDPAPFSMG